MSGEPIRLGCRAYDGTHAILRGLITIPGVELKITEMDNVAEMFARMYQGEFDVSEMSFAELVYYTSRGKNDFVGIPVFPSRFFRHGFIFCRSSLNLNRPEELNGKRIGFMRWVQTAAVWMRGFLTEEYQITPANSRWHVTSIHHWEHGGEEIQPRDGSVIERMEGPASTAGERACQALVEEKLDALGVTEEQVSRLRPDTRVRRLFEKYWEVEADYYRKTRIMPIMHVLALRKSVAEAHPDLPAKLFELFSQAKRWAHEWNRVVPSIVMAWKNRYLDEEHGIFQDDPWAYGFEKNRHVINKFLSYCDQQGISARSLKPEDLFAPSTLSLTE